MLWRSSIGFLNLTRTPRSASIEPCLKWRPAEIEREVQAVQILQSLPYGTTPSLFSGSECPLKHRSLDVERRIGIPHDESRSRPARVALVQVATTSPMFLFALAAGSKLGLTEDNPLRLHI